MNGSDLQSGMKAQYKGGIVTLLDTADAGDPRPYILVRGSGKYHQWFAFVPRSRANELLTPMEEQQCLTT